MSRVTFIAFVLVTVIITGCRKDPATPVEIDVSPENPFNPCAGSYNNHSTTDFFRNENGLLPGGWTDPTYYPQQEIFLEDPVFNPLNPYQIVYVKNNQLTPSMEDEIWWFDFCTGESKHIASNFYYNLDYGSNGWILFTGTGHQVFKIKENGDSLTQITNQSGYNRAGKWSPDGAKYFYTRDNGAWIYDINDSLIFSQTNIYAPPIEWVDNNRLLMNWHSEAFKVLDLTTGERVMVNSHSGGNPAHGKVYDRKHNVIYALHFIDIGVRCYLKYDLNLNSVDTIKNVSNSYIFKGGCYSPSLDKIITSVERLENKNNSPMEINHWRDLLIMNPDGTDQRLISIPE